MKLHSIFGRTVIACLIVVGILIGLSGVAQSTEVHVTPATRISTKDRVLGPLASSQTIHVVISLNLRNQAELKTFLANPHHKTLTPAQFKQAYSPTDAQVALVVNFLHQAGFTSITVASNRQLVSADAPASTVQAAFHTQLVSVAMHDGRNAYANSTPAEIPKSLIDIVHGIMGLQTVNELHSLSHLVPMSN